MKEPRDHDQYDGCELDNLSEENPCKIIDINDKEIEVKNPKAVRIIIEYDDGVIREAVGKDATIILEHWQGCEVMASVHGQTYKGPFLKEVKKSVFRLGVKLWLLTMDKRVNPTNQDISEAVKKAKPIIREE